jgi:hypothetical protein
MSERALQDLIDRVADDPKFAASVRKDPMKTLIEFDLSTVEAVALSCGDEDALRRLLGSKEHEQEVDLSDFGTVAQVFFDEVMLGEFNENPDAGAKTDKVTSSGVTKCCWP